MFLTKEPIHASEFAARPVPPECGGVDIFFGVVRNVHEGKRVRELFYDCYESMAEKHMLRIIDSVKQETAVKEIVVLHRVGSLKIGEIAVAIRACGTHRDEAFRACRAVIDRIKKEVPIWKKEIYEDAKEKWIVCSH